MSLPPELEARAPASERDRVTKIMHDVLALSLRVTGIRNDSSIQLQPLPLQRIDAPTLVMTARDDLFDTVPAAEYLAEHIPRATLVVFDSGGHLFVGRQTEVKDVIAWGALGQPIQERARSGTGPRALEARLCLAERFS